MPSTSKICARWPGGACRAWCSTTSTAARSASGRCARTAAPSRRCCSGRDRRWPPRAATWARPCSASTSTFRSCWRRSAAAACSIRAAKSVAASAAGDAGTIYTLSTLSGCRMEDVKAATSGNAWYQLYLVGGRDVAMGAINRAKAARLQGAGRHDRYAGGRHARARFAQRRQGAARAQPVDACRTSARCSRGRRWLYPFFERRRPDELSQHRHRR